MSTNERQNLNQSQTSRNIADVIENHSFSSPKRTVTVIILSVSRLTDDGLKETTSISGYWCRNKGERNCLATAAASASSAVAPAKDARFRRQPAASLLHHICIPHRLPVGCLPPFVNAGMENARLPDCLAFIAPALCLNFALTLAHVLDNDKRPSLIYFRYSRPLRGRRDCDLDGDRRVPPA